MTSPLKTQLIEPKAPLVFRTGKPTVEGFMPDGLSFPLPSTVAGCLRSLYGEQQLFDYNDANNINKLLNIRIAGPLLAKRELATQQLTALFTKPQDAFYLKVEGQDNPILQALEVATLPAGGGCDLPDGLRPVQLSTDSKFKSQNGPIYWQQKIMDQWLLGQIPTDAIANLGIHALPFEHRPHVKIDRKTLASEAGLLFQSSGLDFRPTLEKSSQLEPSRWSEYDIVLLAQLNQSIGAGPMLRRLGGEGRLVAVSETPDAWPQPSAPLTQQLKTATHIRLILATPALFNKGALPGWLDQDLTGSPPGFDAIQLKLHAVACERWQAISGWDLVNKKPWAVRRMVPAGAVYWFEVLAGAEHLPNLWLQPISCQPQDRLDGFGLALVGLWQQ